MGGEVYGTGPCPWKTSGAAAPLKPSHRVSHGSLPVENPMESFQPDRPTPWAAGAFPFENF